jgi:cyclohexadieny/prephenate dehydrogenase
VRRLALVGAGLIGSSLARLAARDGLAREVALYDASEAVRRRARELALGEVAEDVGDAVRGAELVVVCVPVGACGEVAAALAPHLAPGAILSDVGSTKASVVAQMAPHVPPRAHLVPAHPVAGTEHSGPDAGFPDLFRGRWAIVTPPAGADRDAVARVAAFWRACGSNVEEMTPEHHDMVLAITSHIPHLIAYNIVGTADELETVTESEVIKFSAGGFRDFTRIAASDPTMWRDVFLHNREAVLEMLGRFSEDLALLTRAIRFGDGEFLHRHFTRTRAIRRGVLQAGQDTAAADFGRGLAEAVQKTGGKTPS